MTTDVSNGDFEALIRESLRPKRDIDGAVVDMLSPKSSVDVPALQIDWGAVERDSHETKMGRHRAWTGRVALGLSSHFVEPLQGAALRDFDNAQSP